MRHLYMQEKKLKIDEDDTLYYLKTLDFIIYCCIIIFGF